MALYLRGAGDHVAERVQPEPGSDEEKRLEALVKAGTGNWSKAEEEPAEPEAPKKPRKNSSAEAWVAWAVSQGADEDEAKAADKDDLIKAYGG